MIIAYPGNTPPPHTVLANGAAVSREQYAKLFAVIGTKYGAGNGSTTFNVPDCRNRVLQGGAAAGAYKNAGLPNILSANANDSPLGMYVWANSMTQYDGWESGALSIHSPANNEVFTGMTWDDNAGGRRPYRLRFDASRSSAIYGASNTVQPPALTVLYCIVYE